MNPHYDTIQFFCFIVFIILSLILPQIWSYNYNHDDILIPPPPVGYYGYPYSQNILILPKKKCHHHHHRRRRRPHPPRQENLDDLEEEDKSNPEEVELTSTKITKDKSSTNVSPPTDTYQKKLKQDILRFGIDGNYAFRHPH